ncbi:hypothetical protein FKM82_001321 [Ascaphus truei]
MLRVTFSSSCCSARTYLFLRHSCSTCTSVTVCRFSSCRVRCFSSVFWRCVHRPCSWFCSRCSACARCSNASNVSSSNSFFIFCSSCSFSFFTLTWSVKSEFSSFSLVFSLFTVSINLKASS